MSFLLTRPSKVNRWAVYLCYLICGAIFLLNIHFSAIQINEDAVANGVPVETLLEAVAATYLPAIAVSAVCFLAVGFLTHPLGIPYVLAQAEGIRDQVKTPISGLFAVLISVLVLALLVYSVFQSYQYDIYTTQTFFGLQQFPMFSTRQWPTWIMIAGPEAIMIFINTMEVLEPSISKNTNQVKGKPVTQKFQNQQPQPVNQGTQPSRMKSPGKSKPWRNIGM